MLGAVMLGLRGAVQLLKEKRKRQKKRGSEAHLVSERGKAVEDLGRDELTQLVTFYKQRVSDLEFSLLQTQLKLNKAILLNSESNAVPATKTAADKKLKSE